MKPYRITSVCLSFKGEVKHSYLNKKVFLEIGNLIESIKILTKAKNLKKKHYNSFENTVGKGEIARNEQFFLFPQCFLPFQRTFYHFHQIWNCRLQIPLVWSSPKICRLVKS